jgi:CRP-like cAMP-binding protein
MVPVELVRELPFFRGLRNDVTELIGGASEILDLENNSVIARQHDRAIAFFLLLSGNVQFLIQVEGSGNLLVGVGRDPGLIIGWSVFRAPYRYMTDVRCEGQCRVLRVPHHVFDQILQEHPKTGLVLLRRVAESLAHRLEGERAKLLETADGGSKEPRKLPPPAVVNDPPWTPERLRAPDALLEFLAQSPFFEGLDSRYLHWLGHQAIVQTFARGETLFSQDTENPAG